MPRAPWDWPYPDWQESYQSVEHLARMAVVLVPELGMQRVFFLELIVTRGVLVCFACQNHSCHTAEMVLVQNWNFSGKRFEIILGKGSKTRLWMCGARQLRLVIACKYVHPAIGPTCSIWGKQFHKNSDLIKIFWCCLRGNYVLFSSYMKAKMTNMWPIPSLR